MQTTGLLLLLVQIGFAVHALRRGHPLFWVFLIVFVPVIGCILYVIMVLLPEASGSRLARGGVRAIRQAIDPEKDLRACQDALNMTDTIGNRVALAEEYARHGRLQEAIKLYRDSLTGIYQTDPALLLGLATVSTEANEFGLEKDSLEQLLKAHPDADGPRAQLLLARALDGLGDPSSALNTYAGLLNTAPSAEAKCRYAMLLQRMGREAEAKPIFEEIIRDAKAGNRHSQEINREWIHQAIKALRLD